MGLSYSNSFLYAQHSEYERVLITAVLSSNRIDAKSDAFDDIIYDFKHSTTSGYLLKILQSPNVVLLEPGKPLPTQFIAFASKDVKVDNKIKVFIDGSRIVNKNNDSGKYMCHNVDELIAATISGLLNLTFTIQKNRIITARIKELSMKCFANLFTNIVDNVCKISLDKSVVARCKLMACMYFAENMLGDDYESIKFIARKFTGESEREEGIINMYIDKEGEVSPFLNISTFVKFVSSVLKLPKLSVDIVLEKWLYLYGTKTAFALEYWPALATMITDAYVGCFINNQKTIEKICGSDMVELAKEILKTGGTFV